MLSKPDEQKVKRFENNRKAQKLAALRAEKERKEIQYLLDGQKSLLDNVFEDDAFEDFGGGADVIALEMAVDLALSGELSPEEVVRQEMGVGRAA